jgi:predicted ABC-type ATPase
MPMPKISFGKSPKIKLLKPFRRRHKQDLEIFQMRHLSSTRLSPDYCRTALIAEFQADEWWEKLNDAERKAYVEAHPHSKYKDQLHKTGSSPRPKSATDLYTKNAGRFVSPDEIVAKHSGAKEKIAEVEGKLEGGVPTDVAYKGPDGKYIPEREALHKTIINHILTPKAVEKAKPAPGSPPTVSFLGGRGGSGKSWLTKKGVGPVDAESAIVINPDDIQDALPGYEGWNAALYHEEASDIANTIEHIARQSGLNVVLDSTMRTEKNLLKKVAVYKEAGYKIVGMYMHAPPHIAASRATGRFIHTGRYVPASYILGSTTNEGSFDAATPHFDKYSIYDNSGNTGPQLYASGGKGE